jgi:PatG Domain
VKWENILRDFWELFCALWSRVPSAYIYALGRIEPRFPRLSAEKEYAQATGRAETAGLTDRQALQSVLSQPENRYLARQLCSDDRKS